MYRRHAQMLKLELATKLDIRLRQMAVSNAFNRVRLI